MMDDDGRWYPFEHEEFSLSLYIYIFLYIYIPLLDRNVGLEQRTIYIKVVSITFDFNIGEDALIWLNLSEVDWMFQAPKMMIQG